MEEVGGHSGPPSQDDALDETRGMTIDDYGKRPALPG